ncbi:hypothetical protein [Gillisia limnaea]|uniref:Phosphatidylcholine 1-acylhydrolase n=1 Tax=Gillisia limnaea (strain DSM 15749 / LMG 21470 / R-8282) TaxID=865937 RepID=H2BTE9_GILLR|nr:hypothetical protein [Gillisia limnaea]EHQ01535.1 hypothetical protein Gilli_0839 [Gillisia limnaea DSM 15749]
MKKFGFILFFLGVTSSLTYAQTVADTKSNLSLDQIALVNQGDSYVTFPTDLGNIEPLIFEANVSPGFKIRERKDSRLMAVLTPQIIVRMYDEFSYPVRTPSYMPNITFYFLTGSERSINKLSLFGKIAHHSNGQDGDFYDESGDMNLRYGNFATNYADLGFIKSYYNTKHNAFRFFKSSIEFHPKSWMLDEMQGKYSGLRWHNTFLAYKLPINVNSNGNNKANFSVKAETSWMIDNVNNWETFNLNRLNASLRFYYHPKFLEDIGLFVQFYHGMDYYNIYFHHQISVIRFGIMTEILRF